MAGIFNSGIFNNAIFNTEAPDTETGCVFTNFEDSHIGDEPPLGWTARGPARDLSPVTQTLTVAHSTPPFKRRVATLAVSDSDENNAFSLDALDVFDDLEDVDICVAVFRPSSSPPERVEFHVRGQGTTTITDGYRFSIDFTNARIRIYRRVSSTTTNPFSDLSITHGAGTWKLYRFRANGSGLKAKTWAVGDTQPATWGLEETDGSPITAAGWVGVGAYVPSGTGTAMLNFFSAATGGSDAHAPVLNDEYDAWLDSVAERCWLAEFSATGYDEVGADSSPATPTQTVHAYIANRGYASGACDDPPNQYYPPWMVKVPTFRREMGVALSGRATTGFGNLGVSNPAAEIATGGVRDDWLRMKWKREFFTLLLGDPSWLKFNFRIQIKGVLGQPTAPAQDRIEFPIGDLSGLLNEPIQTERYGAGTPAENQLVPVLAGVVHHVEPVPTSTSTLELQLNDGPIESLADVTDNGISLQSLGHQIASVSGNTITATADHGMTTNYRVRFLGGTPPAPLALSTDYYVIASGLTDDAFQLSATRGGGVITLTDTTAGAFFTAFGWTEDFANGKLTPAASPAGRIICVTVLEKDIFDDTGLASTIEGLIFDRYGLSEDYKDEESFTQLVADMPDKVGLMLYDQQRPAGDILHDLTMGTNAWFNITPDGLLQVGRLALPSGTPDLTLGAHDIMAGSLRLDSVIRPVNPNTLAVRYAKRWWRSGPLNLPPERYVFTSPYDVFVQTPVSTGVPLDDFPVNADTQERAPFDSLFSGSGVDELTRLRALYLKSVGVFSFQTRLKAIRLSIGSVIRLNHPRMGWKQWDSGDPSSPDNTATIDSTLATVIGIDSGGANPFPVKLTVFRQIPGYYPESNVT